MLRALTKYYDCLRRREDCPLPPNGFSKVETNYKIIIDDLGSLVSILPDTYDEVTAKKVIKKKIPNEFPKRFSVPGISAETVDHRGKYLFGLDWDKGYGCYSCSKNSLLAFKLSKETNLSFLSDIESPIAKAYKAFLRSWNPSKEQNNEVLMEIGKEYDAAKFLICLQSDPNVKLNDDPEVKAKWVQYYENRTDPDAVFGQCSISGEKNVPIARIHDNLYKIQGSLATGANLVSAKDSAFWSYGKESSYTSSVSVEVMEKYTSAFNFLSGSNEHKQIIDGSTILFWAQTSEDEKPYIDTFSLACLGNPAESSSVSDDEIQSVFKHLINGTNADWKSLCIDDKVSFYILAVKPNMGRLAVKIFEHNSFGKMMENAAKHQEDFKLSPDDKQIPIWLVEKELKSHTSETEDNPDLSMKMLRSIIDGTPYPYYMLTTAVRRAKTDQDNKERKIFGINRTRVRIIKACLTRLGYNKKGELIMLNEENKDTAYNCGRLFAVLEKIQRDALGDINASIKDKFFSSACSTPSLVFPRLVKLAQAHLHKIEKPGYDEILLQSVLSNIDDSFPRTLCLEKQGVFILGYYNQRQVFFSKKTDNTKNKTNE